MISYRVLAMYYEPRISCLHVYLCFLRIGYDDNTNLLHIAILVVIEIFYEFFIFGDIAHPYKVQFNTFASQEIY